jgi:hypothetical protein
MPVIVSSVVPDDRTGAAVAVPMDTMKLEGRVARNAALPSRRHRRAILAVIAVGAFAVAVSACSPAASPRPASATPGETTAAATPAPPSPEPSSPASSGFAFDAESVVGYYRTQGYSCAGPQPSTLAEGYAVTTCQVVDPSGRTYVVGVVTDAADELADAFASARGTSAETILDPSVALERFAGFLGAMLGEARGEALLTWLAGHLGDDFAQTTSGDLEVATYIKDGDHSMIYVEIANQSYLLAPRPSPS